MSTPNNKRTSGKKTPLTNEAQPKEIANPPTKKQCRTCGETLPFSDFTKNRCSPDRLDAQCKSCRKHAYYNKKAALVQVKKSPGGAWLVSEQKKTEDLIEALRKSHQLDAPLPYRAYIPIAEELERLLDIATKLKSELIQSNKELNTVKDTLCRLWSKLGVGPSKAELAEMRKFRATLSQSEGTKLDAPEGTDL